MLTEEGGAVMTNSNLEKADQWLSRWGVWSSVTSSRVGPRGYTSQLGRLVKGPSGYGDVEDTEKFEWMQDCINHVSEYLRGLNVAEYHLVEWKYRKLERSPKAVWCAAYSMSGSTYDRCLKSVKEGLWKNVLSEF